MDTCSIDKSSTVLNKLINQILKYIGADCTVLGYFHYFIKNHEAHGMETNMR